ncbi:hypothetical protein [Flavobacterium sp. XGLA_31]|uniref:hypothetical protein n=1 Tax=Flavobacterium sp. XGLA_31 TaxID=3447666 RepID=UPI003F3AA731
MKKLIAALTLMLAFSINATAQDKKATPTATPVKTATATPGELAKKDAAELANYLKLTQTETENFYRLFELKYKTQQETALSAERKQALSSTIEAKLRASLNAEQTEKLEKNKELFTRLVN